MMKALFLALVLALLFVNGSALKCYNCFRGPFGCIPTQETCDGNNNACASGRYNNPPFNYLTKCISMSECMSLQSSNVAKVSCCQKDMCNNPLK